MIFDALLSIFFLSTSLLSFKVADFFRIVAKNSVNTTINYKFSLSLAIYFFALGLLQVVLGIAYYYHYYDIRYFVPLFIFIGGFYFIRFIFNNKLN